MDYKFLIRDVNDFESQNGSDGGSLDGGLSNASGISNMNDTFDNISGYSSVPDGVTDMNVKCNVLFHTFLTFVS